MASRTYNTLYEAVGSGKLKYVDIYIRNMRGFRLDIDDGNSRGWTPLMRASHHGREQIVRRLSRQNPSPNPNKQNDKGETALIVAAKKGYDSIVVILVVKLRANVDLADSNRTTAVLWAAKRGRWATVTTLVNNRASVDIADNDYKIPLQYAIRTKNRGNVSRLLLADSQRRSLTVIDNQGRTPLHIAAETGDIFIINLLLAYGANKLVKDWWGRTPAQTALGRGFFQAALVLN